MEFDTLVKKYGYTQQLGEFLSNIGLNWQEKLVIKAIEQKRPERDIIEMALTPPTLDAVAVYLPDTDVQSQFQALQEGAFAEGRQEYLKHCNPDGSFRYSDYLDMFSVVDKLFPLPPKDAEQTVY